MRRLYCFLVRGTICYEMNTILALVDFYYIKQISCNLPDELSIVYISTAFLNNVSLLISVHVCIYYDKLNLSIFIYLRDFVQIFVGVIKAPMSASRYITTITTTNNKNNFTHVS